MLRYATNSWFWSFAFSVGFIARPDRDRFSVFGALGSLLVGLFAFPVCLFFWPVPGLAMLLPESSAFGAFLTFWPVLSGAVVLGVAITSSGSITFRPIEDVGVSAVPVLTFRPA